MKATELRIGNWVKVHESDKTNSIVEVYKIEEDAINGWIFYTPISLTEEWLLKFGFGYKMIYRLNDIEIGYVDDDFVKNQFTMRYGTKFIKIKYIHTLQNLYFALTGKELKIKE